jgi:hypothetical protein
VAFHFFPSVFDHDEGSSFVTGKMSSLNVGPVPAERVITVAVKPPELGP